MVIIIAYPQYCEATFFDSGSAKKKDYTNIKSVLDNALAGFEFDDGPLKRSNRRKGKMAFKHKTEFPCKKQPAGSTMSSFYALHFMREFLRDQQRLLVPESLLKWRKDMANDADDADMRAEFYHIQERIAVAITEDVIKKGGMFWNGFRVPSNEEIKTHLECQNNYRPFRTLDGIHPFPPSDEINVRKTRNAGKKK